ncbi:RNA polymerase sigma factor RpoD/SigA [Chitinispirillales bacterium ANBcel5]|uniref:sigma-70 family RNA polymerase sigma factor n=1 Tax=Cellulosispirillum alkaliphilum TaxID=3039283 RepID=UPI002A5968A6|nr:RNA polymerase sigma factor RpoD/SigA [Chitinispirillales bacterium ANBcel5]
MKTETLYFRDIGRYRLIDEKHERELVRRVQQDDRKATNELITSNLRFVISVARRYRGRGLSFLELINEGNMGLIKAAKRFDLNVKVKFISYAVWWVRQGIQKALLEQADTIRIPPNKLALVNKFKKALDRNLGDYHATIEMEEFRDHEKDIVEVMDKLYGVSLDAPLPGNNLGEESTMTLQDILGVDPDQDGESGRKELASVLDSVLQYITSREERILRMYFGLNFSKQFTLEEIGKELKLTRERVRLIRDRSLRKLMQNPDSRAKLSPFFHDIRQ